MNIVNVKPIKKSTSMAIFQQYCIPTDTFLKINHETGSKIYFYIEMGRMIGNTSNMFRYTFFQTPKMNATFGYIIFLK